MPRIPSSFLSNRRRRRQGVALIIVLAFVVILTGVIVAYFSRSVASRQISNSSASETKVSLFAQGAADTIIGNLQQEIALSYPAGAMPVTSGSAVVYSGTAAMMPQLSGTAGIASPAPNLLIRSASNQNFFTGPASSIPGNAVAVSSTIPSLNGRYISMPGWNSHYLLPLANTTDSTPNSANFAPPDWVLVARNGTNPTSWNPSNNMVTSATNATSVVGRYAYAIYNEGGLLDANVAGYPSTTSGTQSAYKPALSYADLTQLLNSSGTPYLTGSQVDQFVAWRNSASAQAPGTYQNPSFNAASGLDYYNYVLANPNGFLGVSATALNSYTNQSDRMFGSRQELIRFVQKGLGLSGANLGVLNYLTTFSRDLNQPSFMAASAQPNGPTVLNEASGGNDAGGVGKATNAGADAAINPPFLEVRAASAFTRNDGSTAVVGEPLVKKRFALNRLGWLTPVGPIADNNGNLNPSGSTVVQGILAAYASYGISSQFLALGGSANILKYFGLSWDSTNNRWQYLHGRTGYGSPIATLSQVAALNRDADFFEILKASISVGTLGKAYFNPLVSGNSTNALLPIGYETQKDNSVDAQIMQIGANIIAQYVPSGYCPRILFYDGSLFSGSGIAHPQEYRGIEDLPYISGIREARITGTDCVVKVTGTAQGISLNKGGAPQVMKSGTYGQMYLPAIPTADASATVTGTLTIVNPGMAAILQEPEIWNPNVMRSATTSNPVPTRFRIVAISTDPNSAAAYGSLVSMSATNISVSPECIEWNGDTATNVPSSPGPVWNESNAELDFNISAGSQYLFREPTLLVKPGIPAGSNLSVGQSSLLAKGFGAYILSQWPAAQYNGTGVTDNREYIGFLSGTAPVAWGGSVGGGANNGGQTGIGGIGESGTSPIPANSVGGGVLGAELVYSPGAVPAITYRLQYMDPFGNWATYDEKYADYLIATSYNFGGQSNGDLNHVFGPTISGTSAPDNIGSEIDEAPMDPRTGRFGMRTAGRCGQRSQVCQDFPPVTWNWGDGWSGGPGGAGASQNAIMTLRPDPNTGFEFSRWQNAQNNGSVLWQGVNTGPTEPGWSPGPLTLAPDDADHSYDVIIPGLFAQNNPALAAVPSGGYTSIIEISGTIGSTSQPSIPAGGWNQTGSTLNEFFADADGVVRRSMAAYVPVTGSSVAVAPASGQPSGIPMETAYSVASGGVTATPETSSRPMILNRPFLSVADLGYVFSGTPWRNLDVSTPESGFAGLLDAFCVNDNSDPNGLVAGKVNLNTRQAPVIEAILSGAYRDEFNPVAPAVSGTAWPITGPLTGGTEAVAITGALIARTNPATLTGANGPLANLSELAGKWIGPVGVQSASAPPYDGSQSYTGFSNDLANQPNSFDADTTPGVLADTFRRVARFREAATRALANAGQTRVWNLMIDVVAQTGRYPATAAGAGNPLASFLVEGQQRYWVHVAIDRYSGQVIDKQIEVVRQ